MGGFQRQSDILVLGTRVGFKELPTLPSLFDWRAERMVRGNMSTY